MSSVYILSGARTPVGSFSKSLAKLSAPKLGGIAIQGAITKANLDPSQIQEVLMGNVLTAGLGQAPARQAALAAGCPYSTEATTINKVCASGLKAVSFAYNSLVLDQPDRQVLVAGGMESMSNVPFYFPRNVGYGHQQALDGILKDGLTDVYDQIHMGVCAEETAKEFNITREEQDAYAISSYKRSAAAWDAGLYNEQIVPVSLTDKNKKTLIVDKDEEYTKIDFNKVGKLKSAFIKDGTVTAANSSTLNDGASALVLASESFVKEKRIRPLGRILGFSDSATHPKRFTVAPSDAIRSVLGKTNLSIQDVSLFEINEAFSVVVLANQKILNLDPAKINVAGGGVSLGHPIGSSGSRILVSLIHLLKPGQIGVAAICNGGGAATACVVEKL